ncbi:MAG TPA: hypothetical protein DHN33_11515 [Eubacteriaceae bacterium]|nr:hypothetical protein [Eubacteriaceae bacterium]
MGANGKGEIELIDKARGTKKALKKLVDAIGNTDLSKKDRLGIVHCNAPEKAEYVKSMILEKYPFKEIITTQANGLSAVYMDDGGIVIAY